MNKANCACKCEHCGSSLEVKKEKVNPWGLVFEDALHTFNLYDHGNIDNLPSNEFHVEQGNKFIDFKSAERERSKRSALQRIRKYIYDNDMGFEPDWRNLNQTKYFIVYDYATNKFTKDYYTTIAVGADFYLESGKHLEQVIKYCEPDLKILFGVED